MPGRLKRRWLNNTKLPGSDLGVLHAWYAYNATGEGVTIALVGDGLDYKHSALQNVNKEASASFDPATNNPLETWGWRASRIGGMAAATAGNKQCGTGVAPLARLSSILALNAATDAMQAQALRHRPDLNDVYSVTFGPRADPGGPGPLASAALDSLSTQGRDGKGSVVVVAAGDGSAGDNCSAFERVHRFMSVPLAYSSCAIRL